MPQNPFRMNFNTLFASLLLLCCSIAFSQSEDLYKSISVPEELSEKVNSVIRFHKTQIDISAYNRMLVTEKRIVTVYNKIGDRNLGAFAGYDDKRNIKKI